MQSGNVKNYGAVGDGVTDDAPAIVSAIGDGTYAPANENVSIFFPKGKYYIGSSKEALLKNKGLDLVGENGSELIFENFSFSIRAPEIIPSRTGALIVDGQRGSTKITMNDASAIERGDIISITNAEVAETQWGYTKAHTALCVDLDGNDVSLSHGLNFDFPATAANNLVNPWRQADRFSMRNLTIRNVRQSGSIQCFKLWGAYAPLFQNVRLISDYDISQQQGYMMVLAKCAMATISNIEMRQNYIGVLLAECRGVSLTGVRSTFGHHPVSPVTFSDGVVIRDLISVYDNGAVESHPAFNVHYDGFSTYDRIASNLRSVGGSLRNGVMATPPATGTSLFQSVQLVDETIYRDYGFLMENVDVDFGDRSFNIGRAERFCRLSNCAFSGQLAFGDNTENINLRNVSAPSIIF